MALVCIAPAVETSGTSSVWRLLTGDISTRRVNASHGAGGHQDHAAHAAQGQASGDADGNHASLRNPQYFDGSIDACDEAHFDLSWECSAKAMDAYKAAVQTHGSRSIRARDLLRQLVEARNKGLKREVREYRRKKRAA